jgi:hypothetical protein
MAGCNASVDEPQRLRINITTLNRTRTVYPGKGDKMYKRKTVDEYEVQGNYGQGWEMVTTEETRKAAKEQCKCYDNNEPYPHRIVKKRVKL